LLSKSPGDIKIPAIVKAELLYGAEKSNLRKENSEKVQSFLFTLEIVVFGDPEAEAYAGIRATLKKQGRPIARTSC